MGRTPDAHEGPLYEEAIIWEEQPSDPATPYRSQFVQGKGLMTFLSGKARPIGETPESIWQTEVDEVFVDTPPVGPATGYRVIVGDSPTGAFATHAGEIAEWDGAAWVFVTPRQGMATALKGSESPYVQKSAAAAWSWEKVNPGGQFGSELHWAEDITESSTTSSVWQQKLRLTTTDVPLGDYLLLYAATIEGSLASTYVGAQLEQDDTTVLSEAEVAPGPASALVTSGHVVLSAFSGVHTFDIEWRRASGGGSARIRGARLTLWRIS